ncbi:MAG: 50S ribosomal protein L23 [Candidatus Coatesbacteria bacterium]|nr:50S ribosomal protein L23 [Candidatus Coatesbacteria bacterium]
MREPHEILLSPVVGDKAADQREGQNKYHFVVIGDANKIEIKHAVEQAFKVKVVRVNTANFPGKKRRVRFKEGRTAAYKKAIVTLAPDNRINIFENA